MQFNLPQGFGGRCEPRRAVGRGPGPSSVHDLPVRLSPPLHLHFLDHEIQTIRCRTPRAS